MSNCDEKKDCKDLFLNHVYITPSFVGKEATWEMSSWTVKPKDTSYSQYKIKRIYKMEETNTYIDSLGN